MSFVAHDTRSDTPTHGMLTQHKKRHTTVRNNWKQKYRIVDDITQDISSTVSHCCSSYRSQSVKYESWFDARQRYAAYDIIPFEYRGIVAFLSIFPVNDTSTRVIRSDIWEHDTTFWHYIVAWLSSVYCRGSDEIHVKWISSEVLMTENWMFLLGCGIQPVPA